MLSIKLGWLSVSIETSKSSLSNLSKLYDELHKIIKSKQQFTGSHKEEGSDSFSA